VSHYLPCALFLQLYQGGITFPRYLKYPYKCFATFQPLGISLSFVLFPQRKYYAEKMWSSGKTAEFSLRRLGFHVQICQKPEERPSASSLSESVSPFIKWGLLRALPCKKSLKKWKVNKGSRTSLPRQSNFFLHVHYNSLMHHFLPSGPINMRTRCI